MFWCRAFIHFALLFVVLLGYVNFQSSSWHQRAEQRRSTPPGYALPAAFSRILALGYHGILSDYNFLCVATFYGDRYLNRTSLDDEDWDYFASRLEVVTELDPYFLDPYVLGEGLLAWEAKRFGQVNDLLIKGMRYRSWDWQLPYYLGFNSFYFLKDYASGSFYLMRAAEKKGSPAFLKTLAARLAYYGGKSETALVFLEQMLLQTENETLRRHMSKRLLALQCAVEIEEALQRYRFDHKVDPGQLVELVSSGYLSELPDDPYGGVWKILKNGRIYTTSGFVEKNKNK
ncbi:hypothetical protein [Desulfuromonas acetoxidans]|uniref:hypothetical protein n=1 Tax=Desulfuromonas acetoxidans TaxID=891 RepID=UPI00292E4ECF|nr:hypothetical protein [Desulfuromonas acetoxidans]